MVDLKNCEAIAKQALNEIENECSHFSFSIVCISRDKMTISWSVEGRWKKKPLVIKKFDTDKASMLQLYDESGTIIAAKLLDSDCNDEDIELAFHWLAKEIGMYVFNQW